MARGKVLPRNLPHTHTLNLSLSLSLSLSISLSHAHTHSLSLTHSNVGDDEVARGKVHPRDLRV